MLTGVIVYHGLYESTSWPSQWEMAIFDPPHSFENPQPIFGETGNI